MTAAGQTSGSRLTRRALAPIGVRAALIAAAFAALLLIPAAAAAAEAPPLLWKRGEHCAEIVKCDWGVTNGGADIETQLPRGVATDPQTGDVYVADQTNNRIVEFTAWGVFVKAWGWDVAPEGAPGDTPTDQLEVCTTVCKEGTGGPAPGQLALPEGLALDSTGDLYVAEASCCGGNYRLQKFDLSGPQPAFEWMIGTGVDKGPVHPGDRCTAAFVAEGDTCGGGGEGTANGQFSKWPISSFIAIGPADQLYVGDQNRIQQFDASGAYVKSIALPEAGTVTALAADPKTGSLYFSYAVSGGVPNANDGKSKQPSIYKLDPATGKVLDTLEVGKPSAIAVDAAGDVYVFDVSLTELPIFHESRILEFDPSGKQIALFGDDQFIGPPKLTSTGIATGSACFGSGGGVYVSSGDQASSFVLAYGIPDNLALCPPPPNPPTIAAQYATSVGGEEATLGARINPNFWPDTTYSLRYGTAACIEAGGWEAPCVKEQPTPPAKLSSGVISVPFATNGVFLGGLEPGTEYRYRFLAQSGGGGPVEGAERNFTTFAVPQAPNATCANQAFRTGPGAFLPDCRAYEMVSPVDKEGGDVIARGSATAGADLSRLDQSAPAGDALTYSSYRSFGGAVSAPYATQYMARRGASGWGSEPISPPKEGDFFSSGGGLPVSVTESPFKVFTADLSQGWVGTFTEPVLAPGGQAGFENLYRRQSDDGAYEACTTTEPELDQPSGAELELQGTSADGRVGVFVARAALTADANPPSIAGKPTNAQLYECDEGEVHLLSVLPNGSPSKLENSAGPPRSTITPAYEDIKQNAVSADGQRVFWSTMVPNSTAFDAPTYVRIGGEETIAMGSGRFWGAARDGSKAIYTSGGSLFEFEVDSQAKAKIASEALGVAGISEDASRVYFATRKDLGGGAVEGDPNLYLYEAGEEGGEPRYAFIGVLSEADAVGNDRFQHSAVNAVSSHRTAQVSPDGGHLVFMAQSATLAESVAGYDNTDARSDKPDQEVYRYAVSSDELACISCNPSGARPVGRLLRDDREIVAAGNIPDPENSLYAPRVLSEDGSRVFFESFEPLVLADTNGKGDVYEWEEAGSGDCKASDSAYVQASGGCLSLVSSGRSPGDSQLVDTSADGSNVFIRTDSSLVTQDPGSVDIYDARIDGGFPPPPAPVPECEGTSCQSPAGAPNDPTPASSSFRGPGDPSLRKPKSRCAKRKKAKRATNSRCAKKHHHKHRRANHKRRAGR